MKDENLVDALTTRLRPLTRRQIRDQAILDVAFVVAVEAPIPAHYRKAVANYIRGRVGDL